MGGDYMVWHDKRGLYSAGEANARVDKFAEVLSYGVFRGDLLHEVIASMVFERSEYNLFESFDIPVRHTEGNPHLHR